MCHFLERRLSFLALKKKNHLFRERIFPYALDVKSALFEAVAGSRGTGHRGRGSASVPGPRGECGSAGPGPPAAPLRRAPRPLVFLCGWQQLQRRRHWSGPGDGGLDRGLCATLLLQGTPQPPPPVAGTVSAEGQGHLQAKRTGRRLGRERWTAEEQEVAGDRSGAHAARLPRPGCERRRRVLLLGSPAVIWVPRQFEKEESGAGLASERKD